MPLTWSEERSPSAECSYTHVVSETPLGRLYIEWKSWKQYDTLTCQLPWGDFVYGNDLEAAKVNVQAAWDAMAFNVAALATK